MSKPENNIVIVGQGAMGLLWYHYLSQTRDNANIKDKTYTKVSLLASNQSKLSAIELKSAQYKFTAYQQTQANFYPINYAQVAEIKHANIIMLCVKSYHIASALQQIAKNINPQCQVVLAHNGMGTLEEVVKLLPSSQPVLAMLTTHGCLRRSELNIEHTGLGHSDIGLLSGTLSSIQQSELSNLLSQALPTVTFHSNIANKQWLKLAINCVINPITAINDIDNGAVNNKEYSDQVNLLLTEITAISQKEGILLLLTDLQDIVKKVSQATAKNCSSMRCDVLASRQSEVDYINGFIHRLGKKHNIATPENSRLWQQVLNLNA
jgi:2-dehydropantoate 2-reductase